MASTPFSSPNTYSGEKQGKPGRKPKKALRPTKKELKRGMGVEALERLRLQEKWRKMAAAAARPDQSQCQYPTTRFVEPDVSVSMHQGEADYGGAGNNGVVSGLIKPTESVAATNYGGDGNNSVVSGWIKATESVNFAEPQTLPSVSKPQGGVVLGIPANIGGIWGWNGGMLVQQMAGRNGGFNGSGYARDPEKADEIPNIKAQFSNPVYENSKELSSMPNLQQQYLPVYRCDVCLKKKRWNGNNAVMMIDNSSSPVFHQQNNEINNGSYRGKRIFSGYGNAQSFNGGQINGGVERQRSYNHHGLHFGSPKTLNRGGINGFKSYNQGTGRRDQMFMEHEFFRNENNSSKESANPVAISSHGEASNPYYVDLSLKL